MGGLVDVGEWGFAWAIFAAVAGFVLAAAAKALLLSRHANDDDDEAALNRGYNALAPLVDRQDI